MDDPQFYIELACNYSNAGLYKDAAEILKEYNDEHYKNIALTSYYIGYFKSKMDKMEEAARQFEIGAEPPVDYVFPFRLEALQVFKEAIKYNPKDGRAHYYLGLIYAGIEETDSAISHWQTASELDPGNARIWRNLGLSIFHSGRDLEKVQYYYEKAFELAPNDSRILMELDHVKEALNKSPTERLSFLKKYVDIVEKRDELLTSMLNLMVKTAHYNEALDYYLNHHFHNWEGRYTIHNAYMEANIGMAETAGIPEEALKHYLKACEYPDNLEVAPREPNLRGFLYYPMSKLYRKIGSEKEAVRLLKITAGESTEKPTLSSYYQASALRDLGQSEKAQLILSDLREEGQKLTDDKAEGYVGKSKNYQKALGYYYLSKVYEADGKMQNADENLKKAVSLVSSIEREALIYAQIAYAGTHQ